MPDINRASDSSNMIWKLVDRGTGQANGEIDWAFTVGDQVKIRLVNDLDQDHPMHHPFHIHGAGRFLVLCRDGEPDPNLVWKDTVLVRANETVEILLDVSNPGRWMAHCHIAEHNQSGMMFSFPVTEADSGAGHDGRAGGHAMKRATLGRPTYPAAATTVVEDRKAAGYVRSRARWVVRAAAMVTVSVVGSGVPSLSAVGASSVPPISGPGSSSVVDELVEVGGARLHIHCSGAGDTTVVLIAGLGDGGEHWGAIEPVVSQSARVCSYAHFGAGASDPAPGPQTFSTRANDLHALLRAAGEPGPYLLVGHSFGGAEAVMFASMFPADVTGVLLLDASPATWITTLCGVLDDGSDGRCQLRRAVRVIVRPGQQPRTARRPTRLRRGRRSRLVG